MKKINRIICLFLTIIINIENCYAANATFIGQLSDQVTPSGGSGEPTVYWTNYPSNNKMYRYGYKRELNTATTISMNAYNLEGESIIPYDVVIDPTKNTIKAGTWLGINVTETHHASWRVYDFEYKEVRKKYTCKYKKDGYSYVDYETTTVTMVLESYCVSKNGSFTRKLGVFGVCKYEKPTTYYVNSETKEKIYIKDFKESFTCPASLSNNYYLISSANPQPEEDIIDVSTPNLIATMKKEATERVHQLALDSVKWSAGLVKYITNNSYPNDPEDLTYNTINQGTENNYSVDEITLNTATQVKGIVEEEYELLEKKVCINLKTSEVSYGRNCDTSKGEIQLENGTVRDTHWLDKNGAPREVNYWHYFVPLNAKSNSEFTLDIVKNENRVFSINECKQFMETNNEYINYIVPISGENENGGRYR